MTSVMDKLCFYNFYLNAYLINLFRRREENMSDSWYVYHYAVSICAVPDCADVTEGGRQSLHEIVILARTLAHDKRTLI